MRKNTFFRDKIIIITGASSGIGREFAFQLAELGSKIVLAARDEVKLDEICSSIRSSGNQAIFVKTDISIDGDVKNLINQTINTWGRIDIFISNAAQYIQGFIGDVDEEIFRKSFDVNFFGSFYAIKETVPIMKRQNSGHIIFINSLDSKKGIVGDAPYAAAKSALDGFGEVLRQEVKRNGIKVCSVYPGRVDTPMIENIKAPRISPKISTAKVVSAVLKGIQKDKPIIVVPKMLFLLGALNNLFPRLLDWFYMKFQLEGKKIQE